MIAETIHAMVSGGMLERLCTEAEARFSPKEFRRMLFKFDGKISEGLLYSQIRNPSAGWIHGHIMKKFGISTQVAIEVIRWFPDIRPTDEMLEEARRILNARLDEAEDIAQTVNSLARAHTEIKQVAKKIYGQVIDPKTGEILELLKYASARGVKYDNLWEVKMEDYQRKDRV